MFEDAHAGLTLAAESDRTPIVAGRFGRRIHVFDLEARNLLQSAMKGVFAPISTFSSELCASWQFSGHFDLEANQLSLLGLSYPLCSSISLAHLKNQQGKKVSSIFPPDICDESMVQGLSDGLRHALPEYHRSCGD